MRNKLSIRTQLVQILVQLMIQFAPMRYFAMCNVFITRKLG